MNRPIKLIHIVESFGGGTFTVLTQIVNSLNPLEFDVSIAYSLRPEITSDFRDRIRKEVRLIHLPMVREVKPLHDLKSLFQLWKLLKKEQPDVIHLHSSKAGFLGRIAARLSGITRVFYSPHGFAFLRQDVDEKARNLYHRFERIASLFGGTVVACSESELEAAKSVTHSALLIHNAIDVESIDRLINSSSLTNKIQKDKVTIGTVGRITPARAPALFAKIAREVTSARPGLIRLLWIGGGENIEDLSDSPVEVTGWLPREEALQRLSREIDVYLHTSLWEGMPIAILEAMALGKPIVATDVVGNRDAVVHSKTGFLCSSHEELTDALLRLVDDPGLQDSMRSAGRARVEAEFSLPALIKRLSALYRCK
jgi:hypothetical protein